MESDALSEVEDFAVKSSIQASTRAGYVEETPADRVLRETMVKDPLITTFLAGDFFVILDDLVKLVRAGESVMPAETYKQLSVTLAKWYSEWKLTKRYRPYLILLSHLTSLTCLTEKQAAGYLRKIDILFTRDELDMEEDQMEATDFNFLDALRFACHFCIYNAVRGWKARILTEQRKTFRTEVQMEGKKKSGLFGRGGRFL